MIDKFPNFLVVKAPLTENYSYVHFVQGEAPLAKSTYTLVLVKDIWYMIYDIIIVWVMSYTGYTSIINQHHYKGVTLHIEKPKNGQAWTRRQIPVCYGSWPSSRRVRKPAGVLWCTLW